MVALGAVTCVFTIASWFSGSCLFRTGSRLCEPEPREDSVGALVPLSARAPQSLGSHTSPQLVAPRAATPWGYEACDGCADMGA
eukprot:6324747-Pyramimonas_sp.AAC.1